MKTQVNKSHYDFLSYVNKDRFISYYYQLKYILKIEPETFLEVGGGAGILKKLLPENINYLSLDITIDLSPDIIGSVENLPFKDNSFGMIGCFQVLEHLPFEKFPGILRELKRVSSKYVFVSIPGANHKFMVDIYAPKIRYITLDLLIPKFYRTHHFDGQHYWEIGKRKYSRKKIVKIMESMFKIRSLFTPKENSYHTFFLLEK
jgi:ubiquinone/menaquinone biosynthesis C-methylase UbiE